MNNWVQPIEFETVPVDYSALAKEYGGWVFAFGVLAFCIWALTQKSLVG